MFHKSNFGQYGDALPADLRGHVPERGDRPSEFFWRESVEWTPETWTRFVERAERGTRRAAVALDAWRRGTA